MRRALAAAIVLLACAPALAHVGSDDVFYEGDAGPYKLFVTVRPPDVIPGDVATYTARASDLSTSAGSSAPSFLIAGQPMVTLTATTAAPRVQIDARLYDVKPDGARLLVTRGTFTLDSGSIATAIGSADVKLVTYGNLWEVGADDLVQLELTNVDSPYITPSRIPSVTSISNVELTVPVR